MSVDVESALDAVTVHAAGATCTRLATVELPGGASRFVVRMPGLPPALDPHSLRAVIRDAPAGLRLTDVRFAAEVEDPAPTRRAEMEAELAEAAGATAVHAAAVRRLTQEIERTAALRARPPQTPRGEPPRPAPVDAVLDLAAFVDGRVATLQQQVEDEEHALRRATHREELLRHRLDETSGAGPGTRTRATGTAVLTLTAAADAAGPVRIALDYHLPGASWVPVYQLRLGGDGTGATGTLVLRAAVAQRTGEDWRGVRLALSTADLDRRTDLPEPASLRIGRRQAQPPTPAWREAPSGLEELFADYRASADRAPAPSAPHTPVAVAGGHGYPAGIGDHAGGVAEESDASESYTTARQALSASPPTGGYGAPPPAPVAASAPERSTRTRKLAARGPAPQAELAYPAMPAPPGASAAPPPPGYTGAAPAAYARGGDDTGAVAIPQPSAPAPGADLLDYGALELAGADDPFTPGTLRPAPAPGGAVAAEYRRRAESVARQPVPPHTVPVRASAGSFAYRFDTAAPVDVDSDGAWHTVPVTEVPVETAEEYVCVPSAEERVFATVRLTNTSDHALLPGPADITVDGEFLTTVPLDTLAPGAARRVGIGVAESVQVARRTRMTESTTGGLRGSTSVLDHRVEVELANRLGRPVRVEVLERVPVSTDKDVRITDHRAEPAWEDRDAAAGGTGGPGPDEPEYVPGTRAWQVVLEPGRTTVLTGGYEIRIPAGKALVGGNRRS